MVCTLTVECTFSFGPCYASIHQMLELSFPGQQLHFVNLGHPKLHCATITNLCLMLTIRYYLCYYCAVYPCADRLVALAMVAVVDVAAAVVVVVAVGNFEAVESWSMVDVDHERQLDRCALVESNLDNFIRFSW